MSHAHPADYFKKAGEGIPVYRLASQLVSLFNRVKYCYTFTIT